jgi:glyoxalase/bleomycin resistance protein/dioxygenase superfamily protein
VLLSGVQIVTVWVFHLLRAWEADPAAAYEELGAKGVEFTEPPTEQQWGALMGKFRDPDGNGSFCTPPLPEWIWSVRGPRIKVLARQPRRSERKPALEESPDTTGRGGW